MENEIILKSETLTDAIKKIYGYDNGKTRKVFLEMVRERNINIEHLKSRITKYKKETKICPVCGEPFETQIGNREERTTCSHSCSNTYFRSGNNHPNWGKLSETKNHYRRICFEHHKKECVICGENKIVAVHHYDENKKNNKPENLIPMCPTHHQYVHSQYKDEVIKKINNYREKFLCSSVGRAKPC